MVRAQGFIWGVLNIDESDDLYRAAFFVLSQNLVHGDALTMRAQDGKPILFALGLGFASDVKARDGKTAADLASSEAVKAALALSR